MNENALIPYHFTLFFKVSGFLSRNRLATKPEPPGGIIDFATVLGFCMNRPAAMKICQVAWRCSRFLDCSCCCLSGNQCDFWN